jgi:hypothetical protein
MTTGESGDENRPSGQLVYWTKVVRKPALTLYSGAIDVCAKRFGRQRNSDVVRIVAQPARIVRTGLAACG